MGVKVAKVAKCDRCARRLRNRRFQDSVAFTSAGSITAVVCADCLTAEEFIGAEVVAATADIGWTPDGLVVTRPKSH